MSRLGKERGGLEGLDGAMLRELKLWVLMLGSGGLVSVLVLGSCGLGVRGACIRRIGCRGHLGLRGLRDGSTVGDFLGRWLWCCVWPSLLAG